jgi:hypothetical protein
MPSSSMLQEELCPWLRLLLEVVSEEMAYGLATDERERDRCR